MLKFAKRPDLVVFGLSAGGVLVGYEIAQRLLAPLDILVVRKLALPCREELTMGAIAPGGVCVLNDGLIDMFDIESDAIGAVRLKEEQELVRHEQLYRGDRPPLEIRGRTVILVDDGITTSWPAHAAIVYLHQQNAAQVVVAAPVVARDALRDLRRLAAEVVAVVVPDKLPTVGRWFEDFSPPADEDIPWRLGFTAPQDLSRGSAPRETKPAV